MRRRRPNPMRKYTLVLLMALALAVPALAQEQRASIAGVVTDSSGGVLPGVTVEARNASGAVVSTVTNDVGVFRFPALAPGIYEVSAALEGFQGQKFERVEALLGQIKQLQFTLDVGGLAEQVQVTVETPLVDVRQSARATSIRAEQIELLPKGRDFSTLVTQAPGANNEQRLGGISVDGASAGENRFILDGIETTDLQMGTSGKQVIVDFIEELQVKSSGYTAEFGGATGGVINVITKSGTSQFHGSGLFSYEGNALSGGRYSLGSGSTIGDFGGPTGQAPTAAGGRPTLRLNPVTGDAEYIEYAEDDNYRIEPGFAVGGPIVQNKAWFYAAYQPTLIKYDRTVDLLSGGTVTEDQKDTRHFFTANQTAQVSDRLRTRVAFNNSHRTRDGLLPALDGTDPEGAPYGLVRKFPNWSLSGTADWVAKSNLYFGFRSGYYFSDINDSNFPNEPRFLFPNFGSVGFVGTNGVAVPAEFQHGVGFSSFPAGAAFSTDFDKQKRFNLQADGTWYTNFGGQHELKGGVQVDRIGNEVFSGEAGNRVQVHWGDALSTGAPLQEGPFGYYQVRSNGVDPRKGFITEGNVSTTNVGLFIQDAWTIGNRLTINAGLRTERERVPAYALGPDIPAAGIEFDFQDKLAPRVGFAWDVKGDGKWKTYASWGVFYDIFKLELPRGSWGGDKWLEYYYTLDSPDWTSLVSSPDCPPACEGTLIRGPVDFRHVSIGFDPESGQGIDPDIKPMRMQEAAVGLEHQLTNVTAVGVRYLHKQIDRAVEDTGTIGPGGSEIYVIANPGEGLTESAHPGVALPKPQRDYDAVEFSFDKRHADNWSLRLSYQWSRLYGNYSGLSQGDENGRTSPNVGRLYDYPAMMFDQLGQPVIGHLPTDRPHQFKAHGLYSFDFGTSLGLSFYTSSGVPVTRELGIYPTNNLPVQYLGRMSDGRTDVFSQTDLSIQHEFSLAANRRMQIVFNVLNLFDQKAAIGQWQTYELNNGIDLPDEDLLYSGQLDFEQLVQEQGVTQDPRFLQDSWYQFPISARFGVKFLF
ncbi:MAG: TonB-dependent receptor plug domain-containing protein [Luteitalea sp.]|nr:TonB-dependent receptor plug domain-containing protein [Luteitalea sp.]